MTALLLAAAVAALAVAAWPARRLITANPGRRARARRDDTALPEPGGEWYEATPQHPDTGPPLYLPVEVAHEPEAAMPLPPVLDDELIGLGWTPEKWARSDLWGPDMLGRPCWIGGQPAGKDGDRCDSGAAAGSREPVPPVTTAEPEDPCDVAAPEDQADELIGDPAPPAPEPVDQPGEPDGDDYCTSCLAITTGWRMPATGPDGLCDDCRGGQPEDPYDVATPEDQADALVGPPQPELEEADKVPGTFSSRTLEEPSKPAPEDTAYPDWRTGQFAVADAELGAAQ